MSSHHFPREEFAARRKKMWTAMAAADLDWYIAFHPASLRWLTGSAAKGYQAFQCLIAIAKTERLVVITREAERGEWQDDALFDDLHGWGAPEPEDPILLFARIAAALGMTGGRGAMEAPSFYLHASHYERIVALLGSALVAPASSLVHDLRLIKSEREVGYIREAARIADRSVAAFAESLAEGRSELDLAAEIYRSLLSDGAGLPATHVNLVSGPRAGFSHGAPTHRTLARGDFGNVEYSVPYRGHSVSIGRNFCAGAPSARAREIHGIVRHAFDACIAEIRDGVSCVAPHRAARRVIAEAGFERSQVHITGYAIGSAFPPVSGEQLQLFEGSSYTLRAGMVLSVCPAIFIAEEKIGARLVDNVLVTKAGSERLTQFPQDIIIGRASAPQGTRKRQASRVET